MLFDEQADPQEAKNLIEDPALAKVRDELSKLAKQYAPGSRQNDPPKP